MVWSPVMVILRLSDQFSGHLVLMNGSHPSARFNKLFYQILLKWNQFGTEILDSEPAQGILQRAYRPSEYSED